MDWIVAGIIAGIGVALAARRSSYLVDYAVIVYVFNRGLRRVLDYYSGSFNPLSPLSLTPLLVTALMLVPFLASYNQLTRPLKVICGCLFVALTLGFFVGFARIQFAAVYAAAEALAPIAVFGYIVTLSPSAATKDRWLRTSAWCAIVACAYGWYQYVTVPPWDAFWVRAVGMEGYLGIMEPYKISVFSTMAERGVFGGFLGFAVVPMIIAPKWRPLGWFGVVLVLSCILLAGTRTGIIIAAFTTFVYVIINGGTGAWQIALGMAVIFLAAYFGLGVMPGGAAIQKRFSTLGDMQSTGSMEGRMQIYQSSVGMILTNPLGSGLGASGVSGRINQGGTQTQSVIVDAGYAEIPLTYGWIGACLIVYALWRMWKEMSLRFRVGLRPTEVMLGRAFLIALIPACFVGNVITQFSILWIVFGAALDPHVLRVYLAKLRLMRDAGRSRVQEVIAPSAS